MASDPDAVAKVRRAAISRAARRAALGAPPPPAAPPPLTRNRSPNSSTSPPPLQAFTDHYYNMFDTARASLAGLYQEGSMLTFEGQKFMGPAQVRGVLAPPARAPARPLGAGTQIAGRFQRALAACRQSRANIKLVFGAQSISS
jgi:hypothetical protein